MSRSKIIFILALLLPIVSTAQTLNIGTYNIRMNTPSDGVNAWPNRKDRVKALIRFHEFDILGIQEGFIEQMNGLMEMDEYSYVGVGRDDGIDQGEHSAIVYRKDRIKVLESGTFWLSETPEQPSFGWDATIRRICTWAKVKDIKSGKKFYVFNTHFDHMAPTARRESAKLILSRIKAVSDEKLPVICMGDFNSAPQDEPIKIMTASMTNSKSISRETPYTPGGTFPTFKVGTLGNRELEDIDHIFVNDKVDVLRYGVITDSDGRNYPSDHFPVQIKVKIK